MMMITILSTTPSRLFIHSFTLSSGCDNHNVMPIVLRDTPISFRDGSIERVFVERVFDVKGT